MSQRILSDAQFSGQVSLPEGGASRRISDKAEAPSSGYFVSTPQSEKGMPASEFNEAETSKHHASLAGQGGYQGGWNNSEDGKVYLDRSIRVHSRALASSLGHQWGQIAVYDANSSRTGRDLYPRPSEASQWPTRAQARVKS